MAKEPEKKFNDDKYKDKAIRFINKDTHYELIFTDDFNIPNSGKQGLDADTTITDVILDLKEADKNKELHIFVGSYGGYVSCLNMLLQQILLFKYRVGINLGTACSCGFMILAYCNEIYASPFSEFMYHAMSFGTFGKVAEGKHSVEFHQRWWKELIDKSFVKDILTKEELKLGETSEVFLTGKDLISRGVVLNYELYTKRQIPIPCPELYMIGNDIYKKEGNVFKKYIKDKASKTNKVSYNWIELIALNSK